MFIKLTIIAAIPLLFFSSLSLWDSFDALGEQNPLIVLQDHNLYVSQSEIHENEGETS